MVPMHVRGRQLDFNDMGFMADFWAWDEDVARGLAEDEGMSLHEGHWRVIRFLREFYRHHLIPPPARAMFRALGDQLARDRVGAAETIRRLFPDGGCAQACRIAGLPGHFGRSL